jgi:hypothetical protein
LRKHWVRNFCSDLLTVLGYTGCVIRINDGGCGDGPKSGGGAHLEATCAQSAMAPKNMKRGGKKHGKKPSGGGNGGGVKKGSIGSGGTRKPNPKKKSKLVVTFDPEKRKYAVAVIERLEH